MSEREQQAELIDGMASWLDMGLNAKLLAALRAGAQALRERSAREELEALKAWLQGEISKQVEQDEPTEGEFVLEWIDARLAVLPSPPQVGQK